MYISTLSTRKKLPFSPSHDLHVELIPSLCLGMHCCDHPSAKWSKSNPKLECATSFLMPIPLIKRLLYRVTKFKLNFLKFLIKNLIFDNARCSNHSFLDFINNSREPRFARPHSSLSLCMGTLGGQKASYIILFIEDAICLKSRFFFVKIYNIFNNFFEILKKLTYYWLT